LFINQRIACSKKIGKIPIGDFALKEGDVSSQDPCGFAG